MRLAISRFFNNGQFHQTKFSDHERCIYLSKYSEHIKDQLIIDQDYWVQGLYMGLPDRRGLPFADGNMDYTLFNIESLLDNEYCFLNVRDHQIKVDKDVNGLNRKKYFIEGNEHAHEIILIKEILGSEKKKILGKNQLWEHKAFGIKPHEFEEFNKEELEELIQQKEAARVMLVTKSFSKKNELAIDVGEIYNAPYTRYEFNFSDRSQLSTIGNFLYGWKNRIAISQKAMDQEIKAAKEEAMRANKEAGLAKANEQIAMQEKKKAEHAKISEQMAHKKLQFQYEREKKLERQMAGGFAHEMRNALAGAQLEVKGALNYKNEGKSSTKILKESVTTLLKNISEIHEKYNIPRDEIVTNFIPELKGIADIADNLSVTISSVSKDLERGLSITSQIRDYAKMSEIKRGDTEVDIVQLLKEYEQTYHHNFDENGINYFITGLDKAIVKAEEIHLNSIFCNLINNAIDALSDHGGMDKEIRVNVERIDEDGKKVIMIRIVDNGPGIAENHLNEIFEPFFSTKPASGTGLGLGIVKKLIQLYDGQINVESKVNKGTCFIVSFTT